MQFIRITTSQNIDIDYEIAGLGERILARLIDLALFVVLAFASAISDSFLPMTVNKGIPMILILCITGFVFYDLLCETIFNGQSLGKHIMKIKVISLDGRSPSYGQYLMRWIFRIVDFLITMQIGGLVAVILTEKKQRIGDIVAGTTLISTKPRTEFENLAFRSITSNYKPFFPEASRLTNAEIVLINEVIDNFIKSDNYPLLHNTASKFKHYLNIVSPKEMSDLDFLEALIKDYSFAETSTGD